MTDFPETLEIHIIDCKEKEPIEGITLSIHLFANRKNDYWLLTDYSNKKGIVSVTKEILQEEINESRNTFIMDYSSNLEDCKSHIEIIAYDGKSVSDRIKAIEGHLPKNYKGGVLFFDASIKSLEILKGCKNNLIFEKKEIIDIEQGVEKQKIIFEAKLIDSDQ